MEEKKIGGLVHTLDAFEAELALAEGVIFGAAKDE